MGDKTAVDGASRGKGGGWEDELGRGKEKESVSHPPSALFKAYGSGPESEERARDCYFRVALARAREALVFHFISVAKQ